MSEVKRYGLNWCEVTERTVFSHDHKDGDYVKLSDYSALQKKLDAVAAENSALKDYLKECAVVQGEGGWTSDAEKSVYVPAVEWMPPTPATDALLNAVRAEGAFKVADYHFVRIDALKDVSRQGYLFHKAAYFDAVNIVNLLRAETDAAPSQDESLAGGK